MALTVQSLVSLARSTFHDGPADHYQFDTLTPQTDGIRTRYRLLNRQVIVKTTGPAPIDPVIYVNGGVQAVTNWDYVSGAFTIASPPALGALLQAEYYFVLVSDLDFINFALDACRFAGVSPTFTALTDPWPTADLLAEACQLYMASLAAGKMADLSSWYYQANAGNKSFNKDLVAKKFQDTSANLLKQAQALRADPYTRNDQAKAPAQASAHIVGPNISRPWTPRR